MSLPRQPQKLKHEKVLPCNSRRGDYRRYLFHQLYLSVMETQFTPGPWIIHPSKPAIIKMNDYFRIEQTASCESLPDNMTTEELEKEGEANALLIAAAPDMFEVIKELYECGMSSGTKGQWFPKVEAAYLKATGQVITPIENH